MEAFKFDLKPSVSFVLTAEVAGETVAVMQFLAELRAVKGGYRAAMRHPGHIRAAVALGAVENAPDNPGHSAWLKAGPGMDDLIARLRATVEAARGQVQFW